jgi:hypothetical protein
MRMGRALDAEPAEVVDDHGDRERGNHFAAPKIESGQRHQRRYAGQDRSRQSFVHRLYQPSIHLQ